jgi:hypothetical protein
MFHNLKVQCHEIVCQLRPLTYSLDLNNAPRISFKLVKSLFKNIWQYKQGASWCKMARLDFTLLLNSTLKFVTLYWQIAVFSRQIATEKISVDCYSQRSQFESGMPKAWTPCRVHIRPESGGWQSAEHWKADCQGDNIVVAVHGIRARGFAIEYRIE